MSPPRRNRSPANRRGVASPRTETADLWRPVPPPDSPDPIRPAPEPTALLASLGPPPLQGQAPEHYLAAVIDRAAALATALAASAGLLAEAEED